jgi:hypothetical protein
MTTEGWTCNAMSTLAVYGGTAFGPLSTFDSRSLRKERGIHQKRNTNDIRRPTTIIASIAPFAMLVVEMC